MTLFVTLIKCCETTVSCVLETVITCENQTGYEKQVPRRHTDSNKNIML